MKVTKADISRERVLAAAAKIFVERGYAGTTMRAIADDVGLKAGSLYYHFPSKELLIEAVLDMLIHGVSNAVYSAIAALPPGATYFDRIKAAVQAHLDSITAYGEYALASRRVLSQVPSHIRRKHIRLRDAYGDFWCQLLQNGQEAGEIRAEFDVRLARTFILGALNSIVEWYSPEGKSLEEVGSQFIYLISGGLCLQTQGGGPRR